MATPRVDEGHERDEAAPMPHGERTEKTRGKRTAARGLALVGIGLGIAETAWLVREQRVHRRARNRLRVKGGAVAGATALGAFAAARLVRRSRAAAGRGVHVATSLTVSRRVEDVYAFWRNFQNFPRFMKHLDSVTVRGDRSTWRVKSLGGAMIEWDAEVTSDTPNEHIAWRSCEGADVTNRGSVHFREAPGGRGTEVHVELDYEPPGGSIGALVAKVFGKDPRKHVHSDLKRFKQFMETGDVVASDSSIHPEAHAARPAGTPHTHGRSER